MNYLKGSFRSPEVMKNVKMSKISLEGCPSSPYVEFGARACTKKKVLLTEGSSA